MLAEEMAGGVDSHRPVALGKREEDGTAARSHIESRRSRRKVDVPLDQVALGPCVGDAHGGIGSPVGDRVFPVAFLLPLAAKPPPCLRHPGRRAPPRPGGLAGWPLAALLRLALGVGRGLSRFPAVPAGLNQDEAAAGYEALSL